MDFDFLLPSEEILKEGGANLQQFGGINKGGKMILTNERIIFKAHAFNLGSKLDIINLSDIVMTGNTINIFTPSPNMIQVKTTDGTQYQFVVTKKDKEEWLNQISQAADKIHSQNRNSDKNEGSKKTEELNKSVESGGFEESNKAMESSGFEESKKNGEIQPSDSFQKNTVYQEVSRREDLKQQIIKWFSDYKNFKNLSLKQKLIRIAIPVIVLVIIISILVPNGPSDEDYISSARAAVSDTLKSPATATYSNEKIVDEDDYGRVLVTLTVDSQNSFGAYIRTNYAVVIGSYDTSTDEFVYYPNGIQTWTDNYLEELCIESAKTAANWNEPLA